MIQVITPGARTGSAIALASKSQAHRQIICAALSETPSKIICDGMSKDIEATINCMKALGAEIEIENGCISIVPVKKEEIGTELRHLMCGESGSTLRFLLPVVGALGCNGVFHMEGRLPERPLGPFKDQLEAGGMTIRREENLLFCEGQLRSGAYTLPGNISSQYISGLLMALPMLEGDSSIDITGKVESQNYIFMTENVVKESGILFEKPISKLEETDPAAETVSLQYKITGDQNYQFPANAETERDWSNATFFLCMGALSEQGVEVKGLSPESAQGDKAVLDMLKAFGAEVTEAWSKDSASLNDNSIFVKKKELNGFVIDAAKIPDMIPALSAVAATAKGTTQVIHAERLRIKESDRLKTVCDMLTALGAEIKETEDGLLIEGRPYLNGGTVDAAGDHRIAMAAAVAACSCKGEVTVLGSECVSKSYPGFWEDLALLKMEQ